MTEGVSPDTQIVLLLCGRFGRARESGLEPLEPREYYALAARLKELGRALTDLLGLDGGGLLDLPIEPTRLQALMERGGALALVLEGWTSRGLWVLSQTDEAYPPRLCALGTQAPPLLYGAGDPGLLQSNRPALAIVGSRHIDEATETYAQEVARACARGKITVVSGAARGVDRQSMDAALDAGGTVIGVVAHTLARVAVGNAAPLLDGQLTLISPYDPNAGFNVGNAMGRNKHIYALADAALVVNTATREGGTWAGATEALKRGYPPVYVRMEEGVPAGNVELLEAGALAFPDGSWDGLEEWMEEAGKQPTESAEQQLRQLGLW
jgi:predicted Rossmann fold nucleotide-binding protein DprA/Smf involved in DNA uptake